MYHQQDFPNVWLFLEHGERKDIEIFLAPLFPNQNHTRDDSDLVARKEIETIMTQVVEYGS